MLYSIFLKLVQFWHHWVSDKFFSIKINPVIFILFLPKNSLVKSEGNGVVVVNKLLDSLDHPIKGY